MPVAKKLFLSSVIAATVLTLAACDPGTTPDGGASDAPAVITVGVVTSQTGTLAGYGKQYLDGFTAGLTYATDGTNEVGGTAITIENKDDTGDPATAVTAVQQLIDSGVDIIAGSGSSDVALAVADLAAQNKILFISGSAPDDAITGLNEFTFRSGRQSAQDAATAGSFVDDVDGKKVTVLAQNNAFGQGNVASVEATLGAKGATVDSILVAEDATEFTPFAQQLLAANPDLVVVAWAGTTTTALWQAVAATGVLDEVPVVTTLGDSAGFGSYGEASEKIGFVGHYFAGAADNDVSTAMVEAIESAGGTPDLFSPDGFNAAIMLVQAIREGKGATDAMIAALEGFEFEGPKGKMTVRASDHALIQDMFRVKLVGSAGSFVPELVDTVAADDVAPAEAE